MALLPTLLFGALLVGCAAEPAERRDAALVAGIDSLVHLWLQVDPTPGISVAVVLRGDTIVIDGYGLADVEQGERVSDGTVFGVASVTKIFTAAAVMRLVDEGRLRLDASLVELLPEYAGPGGAATVHELLNHTSGIPSYTRRGSSYWQRAHEQLSADEVLALFAREPPDFEPGASWAYNNSAYFLLGVIVERVSGRPFGEYLTDTLLRPLGLERTRLCDDPAIEPYRATGYRLDEGRLVSAHPYASVIEMHAGAGALCSTPRELVRWMRALHGGQLVSEAAYARMTAPTAVDSVHQRHPYARGGQTPQPYGYGLFVGSYDGQRVVSHIGGYTGFTSVLAHYPEHDLTIAVVANGPAPVRTLLQQIAARVLDREGAGERADGGVSTGRRAWAVIGVESSRLPAVATIHQEAAYHSQPCGPYPNSKPCT
jgi:D-alanyl-D-alanine carboxypeptidase